MEIQEERYNDIFPTILRNLMDCHPKTKEKVTQKALGDYLGIRPQTVSLYKNGITQPTLDTIVKMAEFFGVSTDYLLTGVSAENKSMNEQLGLSEGAIRMLRSAYDKLNFESCEDIISVIDNLLSDKEFYIFIEDLTFKMASIKGIKNMKEEERRKLSGTINIEGYYIWDLQMYIEEFIRSQLIKRGMDITDTDK